MSLREYDMNIEQIIGSFLDENFYPKLKELYSIDFQRVRDKATQLLGVDVYMKTNNGQIAIDEKSAAHYINSPLRTFAFELCFLRSNGELTKGWFLNQKLKTDIYSLMWIHAHEQKYPAVKRGPTEYYKKMDEEDIDYIEVYMLLKQDVLDYLSDCGYTTAVLLSRADDMINEKTEKYNGENDITFRYSTNYTECPVNVLIKKTELNKLAFCIFKVSQKKIEIKKHDRR